MLIEANQRTTEKDHWLIWGINSNIMQDRGMQKKKPHTHKKTKVTRRNLCQDIKLSLMASLWSACQTFS